jgi:hypothetical protein
MQQENISEVAIFDEDNHDVVVGVSSSSRDCPLLLPQERTTATKVAAGVVPKMTSRKDDALVVIPSDNIATVMDSSTTVTSTFNDDCSIGNRSNEKEDDIIRNRVDTIVYPLVVEEQIESSTHSTTPRSPTPRSPSTTNINTLDTMSAMEDREESTSPATIVSVRDNGQVSHPNAPIGLPTTVTPILKGINVNDNDDDDDDDDDEKEGPRREEQQQQPTASTTYDLATKSRSGFGQFSVGYGFAPPATTTTPTKYKTY